MNNLKFNGYYLSEPITYENWHAGAEHKYITFSAYKFDSNGQVYAASKKHNSNFKVGNFQTNHPIFYLENDEDIVLILDKDSKYEVRMKFLKLNTDEFINSQKKKFKFVPWKDDEIES